MATPANADFTIEFDSTAFTMAPQYNRLRDFAFSIDIDEDLVAGGVYNNPNLNQVDYSVFGILDTDPTPSGFSLFDLRRSIIGNDFYTQGSSMSFEISATADLSDGLQASELVADATGKIFEFNGHEIGTGRFHPALVELYADGTGRIQNSDNEGAGPGMNQDIDFGVEYIVDLTYSTSLVLAAPSTGGPLLKGDVDFNGTVDFGDIPPFILILQQGGFQAEADCDCNTVVDFADIPAFITIFLDQ